MGTVRPVRSAFFPLDEQLGLRPKVGFTPKVEAGMVRLGTWMPFRAAQRELAFFLGVEVAEATVRQLTEQAGAALVQLQADEVAAILTQRPESAVGPEVQLVSPDGALIQMVTGEWKEVKTLVVGVVTPGTNREGEAEVKTTALSYFSRMSEAETFQQETVGELFRRGMEKAGVVCLVSDGAEWIQHWMDYHRPDAVRILDFPHAMEYVSKGGSAAHDRLPVPPQEQEMSASQQAKRQREHFEQWLSQQARALKAGEVESVLAELERLQALMQAQGQLEAVASLETSLHYLRERRAMMDYARFQAQGYPIGSGSVESANKLVVQSRMKQAGMRWEPRHVDAMLAMRNLVCNERWEEGWMSIREQWHQQELAQRALRTVRPPTSCSSPSLPPPPAFSFPEPASSEPSPPPLVPPKHQPSHPSSEPTDRPSARPSPAHPWRRPFLPRRSAS